MVSEPSVFELLRPDCIQKGVSFGNAEENIENSRLGFIESVHEEKNKIATILRSNGSALSGTLFYVHCKISVGPKSKTIRAASREKKCIRTCAKYTRSDNPAHAQKLIRAFLIH